jgi:hypothetical protein
VQEGYKQETHKAPTPDEEAPTLTMDATSSKENIPPPTLIVQPTVQMIPVIKMKRIKGKNSQPLKKSQKLLAALVDTQMHISRQRGNHLINPTADPSKHFTCNATYFTQKNAHHQCRISRRITTTITRSSLRYCIQTTSG